MYHTRHLLPIHRALDYALYQKNRRDYHFSTISLVAPYHKYFYKRYRTGLCEIEQSRSTVRIDEHEIRAMVDVTRRFRVRELPSVHCSRVLGKVLLALQMILKRGFAKLRGIALHPFSHFLTKAIKIV